MTRTDEDLLKTTMRCTNCGWASRLEKMTMSDAAWVANEICPHYGEIKTVFEIPKELSLQLLKVN
jgi:hypothetical protein